MKKPICFLTFLIIILGFSSCAPKKVRVYKNVEEIRSRVVEISVSLIGKPYLFGGKGPDAFDCSGLIHYVFRSVNIALPLSTEKLIKTGMEISKENVTPGDLVFFKIQKELHAGIMISKEEFIHASKLKGVGVDTLRSAYWAKNVIAFRSVIF
ncbi:MAG: C40 family peptidase [Deltaproteobacteria bacterium]|nr:C40 family peptidase [Deltaproteobacteria bacterium]